MRDKIFYSVCFGFIFGVLLRSFWGVDLYWSILLAGISFGLFLFLALVSKSKLGIIISVFIFFFSLGILRFGSAEIAPVLGFESKVGEEISISGLVIDAPDLRESNQKLTIEAEDIKLLVTTDFGNNFRYGDVLSLQGNLEKPENFTTDQGKEFDYVNYLKKDQILYLLSYPKIEILERGKGNFIKEALFGIKDLFLSKINLAIPSPENLLLGGLILGEKSAFNEELRNDFINTGTIHIVALSGYNITLVSDWVVKIFSFVPPQFRLWPGGLVILLFVIMTGASSTAIRAGIMAALALLARSTGRIYDIGRALLLAGVAMVLINPLILRYDVSFQLSFIATVGLIFFTPRIEKYFLWAPKQFKIREIISSTFAVYIFVLPFILYKMGTLSLVALPANILILPLIPATMILGFITAILGIIWYPLAVPTGIIVSLLLHLELKIIEFFSNIPFASVVIPNFSVLLVIAIYAYFIWKLFGNFLRSLPN